MPSDGRSIDGRGEPLDPEAVSPYFGEAVASETIVAGERDPIVGEQQTVF